MPYETGSLSGASSRGITVKKTNTESPIKSARARAKIISMFPYDR